MYNIVYVSYCFKIFMEGDTGGVSAICWLPDSKLGQAFDSVVGDASSADATGLQDPVAAEVGGSRHLKG